MLRAESGGNASQVGGKTTPPSRVGAHMTDTTTAPDRVTMYGADWCRDCRRTEALLNDLGVEWTKVDVEASAEAAAQAQAISGRMNIPVVVFPDGSHQVEPSDAAVRDKLEALGVL